MPETIAWSVMWGHVPTFVKCDSETTTQNDKGMVNILVGIVPLKLAEFVSIQIQRLAGQMRA